jgi:hypothetical protein
MPPASDDMTDLDRPLTCREFQEYGALTRREFQEYGALSRREFRRFEEELHAVRDELRAHFDLVAEKFHSDVQNIIDWMQANVTGLAGRLDTIETDHGPRLTSLETRVTKIESRSERQEDSSS